MFVFQEKSTPQGDSEARKGLKRPHEDEKKEEKKKEEEPDDHIRYVLLKESMTNIESVTLDNKITIPAVYVINLFFFPYFKLPM